MEYCILSDEEWAGIGIIPSLDIFFMYLSGMCFFALLLIITKRRCRKEEEEKNADFAEVSFAIGLLSWPISHFIFFLFFFWSIWECRMKKYYKVWPSIPGIDMLIHVLQPHVFNAPADIVLSHSHIIIVHAVIVLTDLPTSDATYAIH